MSAAAERYFEDDRSGAVFTSGALPVSEAEIIDFARLYGDRGSVPLASVAAGNATIRA
jgi:hypothetical protein